MESFAGISTKQGDDGVTLASIRNRVDELLRNPAYQNVPELHTCKQVGGVFRRLFVLKLLPSSLVFFHTS